MTSPGREMRQDFVRLVFAGFIVFGGVFVVRGLSVVARRAAHTALCYALLQMLSSQRNRAADHASVIAHGMLVKACGMSGRVNSSVLFPAAAHRAASSSVSSRRWSAVPTAKKAGCLLYTSPSPRD